MKKRKIGLKGFRYWEKKELLLNYIQRHPEGKLLTQIADTFECHFNTIKPIIKELEKEGKVLVRKLGNCKLYYAKSTIKKLVCKETE